MLYEVITPGSTSRSRTTARWGSGRPSASLMAARLPQARICSPVLPDPTLSSSGRCRITSYNVCYTKLLRASPPITLNTWNGGCQQCHAVYHEDSVTAHEPFENAYDSGNNCSRCHDGDWSVPQSNCLNCHATNTPGETTPPVTTSYNFV